jgi:hypothetical protein
MSIFVWLAAGWLAVVVLGWSWLASAARADRAHERRHAQLRAVPQRPKPEPRTAQGRVVQRH